MKLKYLALTASLCATFFAACDDSGVEPKEHIAAYDSLPRFCEESDTVRLSSTGALFYCNNGDWLEVGVIINKPKSSSSTAKPQSSDDAEIESSDDSSENNIESSESSDCTKRRGCDDSSSSSEINTSTKPSSSSFVESSSTIDDKDKERSYYFDNLPVKWQKGNYLFNIGKYHVSLETELIDMLNINKYMKNTELDLKDLSFEDNDALWDTLHFQNVSPSTYDSLYVRVFEHYDNNTHERYLISYYAAIRLSVTGSDSGSIAVGVTRGDILKMIESMAAYKPTWATDYTRGSLWNLKRNDGSPWMDEDISWFALSNEYYSEKITTTFSPGKQNDEGDWELIQWTSNGLIMGGTNLLESRGLQVTMTVTGNGMTDPGIVGIGTYWNADKTAIDLSSHEGLCLAYYWDSEVPLRLELEWDIKYNSDYYHTELEPGIHVKDIAWEDLKQSNWAYQPLDTLMQKTKSLHLIIRNEGSTEESGTLHLSTLGWYGECGKNY